VENVSLAMLTDQANDCLSALTLSALPVKRMSIMFFDSPVPRELMPEITKRLPKLEALQIVVLTAQFNMSILKDMAPLLSDFKHLKVITFVAMGTHPLTSDEQSIASLWHESCPTLKTIILPNGIVWFQKDGEWASGA